MSDWPLTRLDEFIDVKHGFAFKGHEITKDKTECILVTPGNFSIGGGWKESKKYLQGFPPDEYEFSPGDLVVTMTDLSKETDTLGYSAKIPTDGRIYAHNQRVGRVFVKEGDPDFLYWLMRTREYQWHCVASASGTSVMHTSPSRIKEFEFNCPPLHEQEAIAEVLSSLDDKIDLLKRQNKTLEGMAEALFRQWFIEETQDDWEQVPLDDLFEVNPKESITKKLPAPFVEMKNLEEFRSTIGDWRFREFTSGSKFRNGDTLFARITPCLENGKIGLVRSLPTNAVGWGSTEFIVLRPRLGISPLLGFALGTNPEFRELAISSMTGSSGRQRARTEVLHNFTLFMPPASILDEINATIDALESRISKNQAEIKNVTAQRDTLLPKLMSGEVRVQNIRIDE